MSECLVLVTSTARPRTEVQGPRSEVLGTERSKSEKASSENSYAVSRYAVTPFTVRKNQRHTS